MPRLLRLVPTLAVVGLVIAVSGAAGAVALHIYNEHHGAPEISLWSSDIAAAVAFPVVACLVLRRRPENSVGLLLATTFLIGPYLFAAEYAVYAKLVNPGALPFADFANWVAMWGWFPMLFLPTLLPLLFPDGSLPSKRWRPVAVSVVALVGIGLVARMFSDVESDITPRLTNPYALVDGDALNYVVRVCTSALTIPAILAIGSLVMRQRRAQGRERQQLQWLMTGGITLFAGALISIPFDEDISDLIMTVVAFAIPLSIAIAIVRYGLLDIEVVLNRAVVYLALSALVLAAYGGAVLLVGQLSLDERSTFAIVAVAALLAASARDAVQRVVNRALFGERRNPYAVIQRVGGRLDDASGPVEALRSLADELSDVLKLPFVAIVSADSSLSQIHVGDVVTAIESVPIFNQGDRIGTLEVGHRHASESFNDDEKAVFEDVARRAGALLHAVMLLKDLQRSREHIIAAREEERRRLRHDIHDGLGPELAGMALQLEGLAGRLNNEPELANRVEKLRDQLRHTVSEVRRVVDGLRPPALDEHGLVEALRRHVQVFAIATAGAGAELGLVSVNAPDDLPKLSAAVEVAAFRIATEAVTNVVRHSGATECEVNIDAQSGWLKLEVVDNGRGLEQSREGGVGLTSMQDRAVELGGTFEIDLATQGGTIIRARLPLEMS